MTRMLSIATFFLVSASSFADQPSRVALGNSTLNFWLDRDPGIYSIEITDYLESRVEGRTSYGNGIFNLERVDSPQGQHWKGFADDGFVDLKCAENECRGIVGSDTTHATATLTGDTWEIKGSMNHVYIHAKISPTKIEIHGDGSLILKKDKKREGLWSGNGYLGSVDSHFTAELKSDGSLRNVRADDQLGLFLIYMVSPLVRN